jgi:hypothetical protein
MGFGALVNTVQVGSLTFPGIHYTIDMAISPSGKAQASAQLSLMEAYPCLSFENIVKVLGPTWHDYRRDLGLAGRIFDPPTYPLGNNRIRYVLNDPSAGRSIVIELLADGHMYNAHLLQEEK